MNKKKMMLQNLLQPLLFIFVFCRVMTTSGMMPQSYNSMLLPGIIAISMFFFSIRRRHTRFDCDWSSDVCSSDLASTGGSAGTGGSGGAGGAGMAGSGGA